MEKDRSSRSSAQILEAFQECRKQFTREEWLAIPPDERPVPTEEDMQAMMHYVRARFTEIMEIYEGEKPIPTGRIYYEE